MMQNFKYSYCAENDDLFLYLENSKSKGSIEVGNFVLDFDKKDNLVGIQIFEASKIFSKILSNIVELTKIKEINIETENFRNMRAIKINIETSLGKSKGIIGLPDLNFESPALLC
jgi:uncharacterized protein YuzE